jgi:hypothetical protein
LAQVAQVAQVEPLLVMVMMALLEEPQHLVVFFLVLVEALELVGICVIRLQVEAVVVLLVLEALDRRQL